MSAYTYLKSPTGQRPPRSFARAGFRKVTKGKVRRGDVLSYNHKVALYFKPARQWAIKDSIGSSIESQSAAASVWRPKRVRSIAPADVSTSPEKGTLHQIDGTRYDRRGHKPPRTTRGRYLVTRGKVRYHDLIVGGPSFEWANEWIGFKVSDISAAVWRTKP